MPGQSGTSEMKKAILTALLINVLAVLVCFMLFSPVFETNDDSGLIAIACGARGIRDAHLVHANYLIGRLMTAAFAAAPGVQWWSLLQFFLLFISFFTATLALIRRGRGIPWTLFVAAVIFVFSYEAYIRLQYTKTAGIISAAGLIVLFCGLAEERSGRRFFIAAGTALAVLGSFYRFQQFLCITAVFGAMALWLLLLYLEEHDDAGRKIAKALAAGAVLLILAGGFRAYDRAQYRSQEWADYLEFDKYRTEVIDYGVPDYDAHEAEYNAAGIDRTAYDLMKSWTFQDSERFTAEAFRTIAGFRDKKEMNGALIKGFIKGFVRGAIKESSFIFFLIVLAGWLITGEKKKRNWISLIALGAVIGALEFYLYYAGRFMVNRVDAGIWFAASVILLAWYFPADTGSTDTGTEPLISRSAAASAVLAVLTLAAFVTMVPWQDSLKAAVREGDAARAAERASIEKISSDKDHLYLSKVGTVKMSEAYGVMDPVPYCIADNIYPLGGWGAETPVFKSVLERYGADNPFRDMTENDSIYLVDNDIDGTLAYLRAWYRADAEAELVGDIDGHKIYRIKQERTE